MKGKVHVCLKSGVLDPQGKAIGSSIEGIGVEGITDVRQGKYFEILFKEGVNEPEARATLEQIARDVLSNPVIEDFTVEIG